MGLIIYMVCALRQYGRWLRDNYADLEHKEVWQSFVVLAFILLVFVVYALINTHMSCWWSVLCLSAISPMARGNDKRPGYFFSFSAALRESSAAGCHETTDMMKPKNVPDEQRELSFLPFSIGIGRIRFAFLVSSHNICTFAKSFLLIEEYYDKKIKDKERDSIDFGKSKIEPLFNSIFYPTLLSIVFASLFTVADGIVYDYRRNKKPN